MSPFLIDEQKSIHIYRIVQEVIHNTLKHAKASELVIDLKKEKKGLIIYVKDNGVGFDYNKRIKENLGLGLRSLLNRTSLLQGEFSIDSKPGEGTTHTIKIPL